MAAATIQASDGDLPAYLATPARPAPWPGVVVIHDVMGCSLAAGGRTLLVTALRRRTRLRWV